MEISISTTVKAPLELVWSSWISPNDITRWNFASDDWCCPTAQIDLRAGGKFSYRMEARDGSMGFNFEGEFTKVEPTKAIQFTLGDNRKVEVLFEASDGVILVTETFEAEDQHTAEQQEQGWQSILNNFKSYVESRT